MKTDLILKFKQNLFGQAPLKPANQISISVQQGEIFTTPEFQTDKKI